MARDWTPRSARAKGMRKLNSLRKRVQDVAEDIGYEFGDFDNSVVLSADDLRDSTLQCIENLETALADACEAAEADDG